MTRAEVRPLQILSVEDDPVNQALLRATLARAGGRLVGARVSEASQLAQARRALAAEAYDLVLLDRRLPDGDGFELIGELRRRGDATLIIVLTADAVPATTEAALMAGCDAIMTKPYVPAALVSLLEDQLQRRGLA